MVRSAIIDFCDNDDNDSFFRAAECYSKEDFQKLSYFEKFALACDVLPSILCSDTGHDFLNLLESALGQIPDLNILQSREGQKNTWKALHGEAFENIFSDTEKDPKAFTVKCDNVLPIDICNLVANYSKYSYPDSLEAFISEVEKAVLHNKNVLFDMSDLDFLRPDAYHSQKAYENIKNGIVCEKGEFCGLISYVLCDILSRHDVEIFLITGNDVNKINKMLDLFKKRKILKSVKICFDITQHQIFNLLFDILVNYPNKNISLEIIIPKEINNPDLIEKMRILLKKIPISRLTFHNAFGCNEDTESLLNAVRELFDEKYQELI